MNLASVKLLAFGPVQLAVMIVMESLALTAISLALGLALGLSVEHYFATSGLDLRVIFRTSLPSTIVLDPILYSRLSLGANRLVREHRLHDGDSHIFLSGT